MNWIFDYSGEWTAESQARNGLTWRIQVCDDGTFDISRSDHGLTDRKETFQFMRNAKAFCEAEETVAANIAITIDGCFDCGDEVPVNGLLFCERCENKNEPRPNVPTRCVECGGKLDADGSEEKCHICCEYPSSQGASNDVVDADCAG